MLKRMINALKPTLTSKNAGENQVAEEIMQRKGARRGFFKKAALGAVALSGTAGLAKVVVESVAERDPRELYEREHRAGEQELKEREYVLMSDQEKDEMVRTLVDSYHEQT